MKRRQMSLAGVIIMALLLGAGGMYLFSQFQKSQTPTAKAQKEISDEVNAVGQLMELPTGEIPTLATVSDITKLQKDPLFAHAKNGDKVLIYTNAKKVIVYRPSENKIIDVSSLNIAATNNTNAAAPTAVSIQKPLRVAIYNSSTTSAQVTNTVAAQVKNNVANVQIVTTDVTHLKYYPQSLLINLSSQPQNVLDQVNAQINAQASALPVGETKPNADVLIIIGNNYVNK